MAMSALMSTSTLSSLEAMLHSLMRGGGDDNDMPIDDTLASLPPLPARPTPRGRHPSQLRVRTAAPWTPPPSPVKELHARADDAALLVELERKAVAAEKRLRQKEEENAALKRRIEGYHIRWLEYEIKLKSLEDAFHEQMAALQMAQDATARAGEAAYDCHESCESHMKKSEEPPMRLRHDRDRLVVGARRSSAVSRLGAEFRLQSHALEQDAAELVVAEPPRPWQPGAPSANAVDDLRKLKAQFRAWKKDYKARLRRTTAELDRDKRRRGSCWI